MQSLRLWGIRGAGNRGRGGHVEGRSRRSPRWWATLSFIWSCGGTTSGPMRYGKSSVSAARRCWRAGRVRAGDDDPLSFDAEWAAGLSGSAVFGCGGVKSDEGGAGGVW